MTSPLFEIQRLIDNWLKAYPRPIYDGAGHAVSAANQAHDIFTQLRSALGAAPQKEALNIDGEPLHTGDDDRIDYLTGIRAGLEEIVNAEDDEYEKHEIVELVRELFDDCDQLDALLIETIANERAALSAAPAARQEEPSGGVTMTPGPGKPAHLSPVPPKDETRKALKYAIALIEDRIPVEGNANKPILRKYIELLMALDPCPQEQP